MKTTTSLIFILMLSLSEGAYASYFCLPGYSQSFWYSNKSLCSPFLMSDFLRGKAYELECSKAPFGFYSYCVKD